jgi:VanZ family protein
VWALVILVLLSLPKDDVSRWRITDVIPHFDKMAHAGIFAILNALLIHGFKQFAKARLSQILMYSTLLSASYGLFTELLQLILPFGRAAELWDGISDLIGVISGIGLFLLIRRFGMKRKIEDRHAPAK